MLELATKTINLIREQIINAVKELILSMEYGVTIPYNEWPSVLYIQSNGDPTILKVEHVTTFDGKTINVCGVAHDPDGSPFQDTPDINLVETDGLLAIYRAVTTRVEQERKEREEIAQTYNRQA